jgi:hypothetical protein
VLALPNVLQELQQTQLQYFSIRCSDLQTLLFVEILRILSLVYVVLYILP